MTATVANTPETRSRSPRRQLALASLLGAAFVVVTATAVAFGVAQLITGNSSAAAVAQFFLTLLIAGGIVFAGLRYAGFHPPAGFSAGVTATISAFCAAVGIAVGIGGVLAKGSLIGGSAGLALMAIIVVGLMVLSYRWFAGPRGHSFLVGFEEQGWFKFTTYKRQQGLKVRRLTILGILILGFFGAWNLHTSNFLQAGVRDWTVAVPFTEGPAVITLVPYLKFNLPILVAVLSIWFAVRVVNFPVFADFLIATEAELNKVSWTPRKQLFRDTIVVLVTVFLLTVFLLFVDQVWGWTFRAIGVLPKVSSDKAKATQTVDRKY